MPLYPGGRPRQIKGRSLMTSRGGAPVLDLNFLAAGSLDSRITFTRASAGTYFDAAGTLQTAAANVPRFDRDPVTGAARGLLIEEARTNLLKHSSDFSQAATWGSACAVTQGATAAPDGSGAQLVADANAAGFPALFQNVAVPNDGSSYAFSLHYKAGSTRALSPRVYFSGGTTPVTMACSVDPVTDAVTGSSFTSAKIDVLPNNWRRISCVCANNGTGNTAAQPQIFPDAGVASGTGSVYLWGAQLESGSFATSYIPATTAAATRAADVASMLLSGVPGWGASEGAMVAEGSATAGTTGSRMVAALSDGTGNNAIRLFRQSDAQPVAQVLSGGADQITAGFGATWTDAAVRRLALAWRSNDFAACVNGGTVATDASGAVPVVTTLGIGQQPGAGAYWAGHIRRLRLYNRRLSNAQMQGLTA